MESFGTNARPDARGTVRGAEATHVAECETWENAWCGYQTNEFGSCGGGCGGTGTGGSGGATAGHTCLYASCDGFTC